MIIKSFLIICGIVVLFIAYGRFFEHRSLYSPFGEILETPDSKGWEYNNLFFNTKDRVRLNAWFIPSRAAVSTILFLHGNGGNISHRLEKIGFFRNLGLNVFIIDYRGYGQSSGWPSEAGLYCDAQAAYDYCLNVLKIPPSKLVVFGESLGSAVAVELASKNDIRALILEGAFTSVNAMAGVFYPFLPKVLIHSQYDSLLKIGKIKVPLLVIHASDDEIVPFEFGRRLFEAAVEPKTFLSICGGHNSAFMQQEDKISTEVGSLLAI